MKRTIVLHARDGYGLVPTTLSYGGASTEVNLLLDTGAARTTVSYRLARELRLPLDESGRLVDVHGVGGVIQGSLFGVDLSVFGEVSLFHEVQFVPFTSYRVGIGRASLLCEGLLGNDLLRSLGLRAVFDVPKNRAVLATRPLR